MKRVFSAVAVILAIVIGAMSGLMTDGIEEQSLMQSQKGCGDEPTSLPSHTDCEEVITKCDSNEGSKDWHWGYYCLNGGVIEKELEL